VNSEQLRLFINGAFGNEADARAVRRKLEPYLKLTLAEIREIVEQLAETSLTRQKDWRALLSLVEEALMPYNDALAIELTEQLPASGLAAAEETTLQLKSVMPRTAGGVVPPEAVMADSTKFLLNTKISDKRVLELFAPKTVGGISPFTAANRRMIDTIVTGGIIKGASTKEIARAIKEELPKKMRSQSLALARTAIQDYNRQVKEAVWDANEESFVAAGLKYEWVAALDSRTCPTCAPLDGEVRDKRTGFPKTPVHVNCRCQVVLIDPDDEGEVRYGQQAYDQQPTGEGVYRTKKKVKGENLFRKNVEVKTVDGKSPRYADFLANSNRTTQAMFFGGGNPGAVRAERFRRMIKNGRSPQDALKDLTNRVPKTRADRRFKPVTD
jgi:SPP1 gp7 family putative phage head morphogenesis protein